MTYTIKISDAESKQAQSLLIFLQTLADSEGYKFLQIFEDDYFLSEEQEAELNRRYEYVVKNPEIGKSWDEIEQKLLSK